MKKNWYLLFACLGLTACGTSGPPGEVSAGSKAPQTDKAEVVLTAEQLAAANIETQTAALSSQPELLRVKGTIALADGYIIEKNITPGIRIQPQAVNRRLPRGG